MFVLHKTPIFRGHCSEEFVLFWEFAAFCNFTELSKGFQELISRFPKVTIFLHNQFAESRHIVRNSIIKDSHLDLGQIPDGVNHRISFWQNDFSDCHHQHFIAVIKHLRHIELSPFWRTFFIQSQDSAFGFFPNFGIEQ